MALFGSKKKKEVASAETPAPKASKKEVAVVASKAVSSTRSLAHIIKRPRITEKASIKAESHVYAFEVAQEATKSTIAMAVKELYNVDAVKVAVVAIPSKQVIVRNRRGIKKGGKKAYVYLKEGQTIEFV